MLDEEICLEVCGSCTQEEIWKDKDCKVCHRNMLEALKIVKRFTWCAYCGKEFPLDNVTADQVGEHISICEKHPLFLANKRIKELEEALDQAGSKLDEQVVYYGDVIASKNDRIKELEAENKNLKILADMRQT
jgi:hypothetical protein